jgi:hypothetical protein
LSHDDIIAQTTEWLEKAVIGLNLCPFAKAVHVKKQIRYVVSESRAEALLEDLRRELEVLAKRIRKNRHHFVNPSVCAEGFSRFQ